MILDRGLMVPNFLCVVVLSPCVSSFGSASHSFLVRIMRGISCFGIPICSPRLCISSCIHALRNSVSLMLVHPYDVFTEGTTCPIDYFDVHGYTHTSKDTLIFLTISPCIVCWSFRASISLCYIFKPGASSETDSFSCMFSAKYSPVSY